MKLLTVHADLLKDIRKWSVKNISKDQNNIFTVSAQCLKKNYQKKEAYGK